MRQTFGKILDDANYVFIRKGFLLFFGYIFLLGLFMFTLAVINKDLFPNKDFSFVGGVPPSILGIIAILIGCLLASHSFNNAVWAWVRLSKVADNDKSFFGEIRNFIFKLFWVDFCGISFYVALKIFSVFIFKGTVSHFVLYQNLCLTPIVLLTLYSWLTTRVFYRESLLLGWAPLIFSEIAGDYSESEILLNKTFSKVFGSLCLLTLYSMLIMFFVFVLSLIFKPIGSLLFLFFDNLITIFFACFLCVLYFGLAGKSPRKGIF